MRKPPPLSSSFFLPSVERNDPSASVFLFYVGDAERRQVSSRAEDLARSLSLFFSKAEEHACSFFFFLPLGQPDEKAQPPFLTQP